MSEKMLSYSIKKTTQNLPAVDQVIIDSVGLPILPKFARRTRQERGTTLNGGYSDVSTKAAGHSKEMKARYYKKVSYKEAQESFGKYHQAFLKGW